MPTIISSIIAFVRSISTPSPMAMVAGLCILIYYRRCVGCRHAVNFSRTHDHTIVVLTANSVKGQAVIFIGFRFFFATNIKIIKSLKLSRMQPQ
ncbi:MAG: hypothetical protein FWE05_11940 [Defluviitaleaceae bacterium]|nr:hypothetical protein [Defluviitaleaceae bacterium]